MKTAVPDKSQHLLGERSRRNWAREILSIPADASPDAVQSELLGRLEAFDFVPPLPIRQAIGFLSNPPVNNFPTSIAAQNNAPQDSASETSRRPDKINDLIDNRVDPFEDDIEARLTDEIEEFARTYFEQPCLERRRRWVELTAHARPFPRLRMRLSPLLAGLDVATIVPHEDSRAELLGRRVRLLFVLPPAQQESVRQQWLREMRNSGSPSSGPWKSDVRKFRAHFSKLASLEPDLLLALEMLETTEPRREAPKTAIPGMVVKAKSRFTPTVVRRSEPSRSRTPIVVMLVWVGLVGGTIRYIFDSAAHLSSPAGTSTSAVPAPAFNENDSKPSAIEPINANPLPREGSSLSGSSLDTASAPGLDTPTAIDPTPVPHPDLESATHDENRTAPGDDNP